MTIHPSRSNHKSLLSKTGQTRRDGLMAGSLDRLMARRIGREFERAQPKTIFRNLLDLSAKVEVQAGHVVVTIDKRAYNPFLVASGLADKPALMPWFGSKKLLMRYT